MTSIPLKKTIFGIRRLADDTTLLRELECPPLTRMMKKSMPTHWAQKRTRKLLALKTIISINRPNYLNF